MRRQFGHRLVAASAEGNQDQDIHQLDDVRYQLISRRGGGGAPKTRKCTAAMANSTVRPIPRARRRPPLGTARQADRHRHRQRHGRGPRRDPARGQVPVLYVPGSRSRSTTAGAGLLYPSIGSSSRSGWKLAPTDLLQPRAELRPDLTPRYMSQRGLQLGRFRYLLPHGRGDHCNSPTCLRTSSPTAEGPTRIAEGFPWTTAARNRGMFRFKRHAGSVGPLAGAFQPRLAQRSPLPRGFEQQHRGFSASASKHDRPVRHRPLLARPGSAPTDRSSRTTRSGIASSPWPPAACSRDGTSLRKHLTAGVDARNWCGSSTTIPIGRAPFRPEALRQHAVRGNSWFATPTLAWRYTGYHLESDLAAKLGGNTSRAAACPSPVSTRACISTATRPCAGTDSSDARARIYLYAPYRDQRPAPVRYPGDDVRLGLLFRDNGFHRARTAINANQMTIALSSRFCANPTASRNWRSTSARSAISIPRWSRSARRPTARVVALDRGRDLCDQRPLELERLLPVGSRGQAPVPRQLQYALPGRRYRRGQPRLPLPPQRAPNRPTSFLYPISARPGAWSAAYYSFYRNPATGDEPGLLEGIAGVQWDSCCLAVRAWSAGAT